MEVLIGEDGRPVITFPVEHKDGSFWVDAVFSDDGRLVELFISTETGNIDKDLAAAAITAATAFHKLNQSSVGKLPLSAREDERLHAIAHGQSDLFGANAWSG